MLYLSLLALSLVLTTVATAVGQNSVSINQNGGAGNSASVTQAGAGNSVSINQSGSATSDGSKPGNRVSLRVPTGTKTTINQHSIDPNSVEISQEGQATATINQSSETGENAIHTLPRMTNSRPKPRPANRRHRRQQ